MLSGASDGNSEGKDRISAALVGMALLFTSGLILYTINPNFFKMDEVTEEKSSP